MSDETTRTLADEIEALPVPPSPELPGLGYYSPLGAFDLGYRDGYRDALRAAAVEARTQASAQPAAAITPDERDALAQALEYMAAENGKSHQGYFGPGGWAWETLHGLLERSRR